LSKESDRQNQREQRGSQKLGKTKAENEWTVLTKTECLHRLTHLVAKM
jgi:hypothetical protein